MTTKEQLSKAKKLIQNKRYDEARQILQSIDHPIAEKWLAKLDNISPSSPTTPSQSLPKHTSSNQGRGSVIETFGLHKGEMTRSLLMLLVGIIAFIGFFLFEMTNGIQLDSLDSLFTLALPFLILSGGFLVGGKSLYALIQGRQTIIYENGVMRKTRNGGDLIPWEAIDGVKGMLTNHTTAFLTFFKTGAYTFYSDGKPIFKVSYIDQNHQKLYKVLNHYIIDTHKPRMIHAIKNGETVTFEDIHVSRDGIRIGQSEILMSDLGSVTIQNGYCYIKDSKGKNWKTILLEYTYNPHLLQALVEDLRGNV